ncbi:MAG TPA: hypothetical protein DCL44_05755 [Elusimicrobia bacterium]|nr:hypothetical protein [Elusimicrobiota bacterium]
MKTKLFFTAALAAFFSAGARIGAFEGMAIPGQASEKNSVTRTIPVTETAQARPETASPEKPAYTLKYQEETRQTIKDLAAILAKQDRLDPKKLDDAAKDIVKLDKKLKALLGLEIIKELETEEKALLEKEQSSSAKTNLALVRSALQIYYGDHNGVFPDTLYGLTPDYLNSVPDLQLPGHEKTDKITMIDSRKHETSLSSAVADSGGWLYFTNKDSINSGMLIIDCSHKDPEENLEWYKY